MMMVVKKSFINKQLIKTDIMLIHRCLTYLKKEIRNSIMPKNIKDIDIVNCHPVILNYLCKKIILIVIF